MAMPLYLEDSKLYPDEFQSFLKSTLPVMGYRWRRFNRRNIRRRVRSRMESLGIHEMEKYARLVRDDKAERDIFDSLLRLTISRFFRNAWLWNDLESMLVQSFSVRTGNEPLSAWSAGCAGGEEPFSLAMLLDDLSRTRYLKQPWNILGTDSDPASIDRARKAEYKWGSLREVPPALLDRWFIERDGIWFLDKKIKDTVKIKCHDLLTLDPPGRFHIVFLRNSILTYNTDEIQRKVLYRIRECLLEPGYLVIGRTETMPEGTGFVEVSKCIYKRECGM